MSDPRVRARLLRIQAAAHRAAADHFDVAAAAIAASAALQDLLQAASEGDAADVAAHPDLAYLDVQMNGFYD
ncbi:hypothetical protein [Streptosporangium sp. NPDC003464]